MLPQTPAGRAWVSTVTSCRGVTAYLAWRLLGGPTMVIVQAVPYVRVVPKD